MTTSKRITPDAGAPWEPPRPSPTSALEALVLDLRAHVADLESRLDRMAEEVVTKRLVTVTADVTSTLQVGKDTDPRLVLGSVPDYGFAGITGYSKGDDTGFVLDAYQPEHPTSLRSSESRAQLTVYGPSGRAVVEASSLKAQCFVGDTMSSAELEASMSAEGKAMASLEVCADSGKDTGPAYAGRLECDLDCIPSHGAYLQLSRGGNSTAWYAAEGYERDDAADVSDAWASEVVKPGDQS